MANREKVTLLLILIFLFVSSAWGEEVTIYRDTWGIPHIYAESAAGAAFGQGYAQAEDRLEQCLRNFRGVEGRLSEVFGEEFLELDVFQRFWRHAEECREGYSRLSPELREVTESFVQGFVHYMRSHPDQVPEWGFEPEPYHCVALMRSVIYTWPVGEVYAELNRPGTPAFPFGSNQFAVSPQRSAEGCAMLVSDPHVPWDGAFRWHEVHLHCKDFNLFGFGIAGVPLIGFGHNDAVAWACTTGGPDTCDVYEVALDPDDPSRYIYDGESRRLEKEELRIRVKIAIGHRFIRKTIYRTHHGPVIFQDGGKVYAAKLPYSGRVGIADQIYKMCAAENLEELKSALAMNEFMAQNVMVADVDGNIYYVRTGRVPVRPEGYDWNRPVPGNTSATEWNGIHPMNDLVQILNPQVGFMQNNNIGPDRMMPDSPLRPERYPPYIYHDIPGRTNPRGIRAIQLLEHDPSVTREELMEFVMDTFVADSPEWQYALRQALAFGELDEHSAVLAQRILEWDGRADWDSFGAAAYLLWRQQIDRKLDEIPLEKIQSRRQLDPESAKVLVECLGKAAENMQSAYSTLDVKYGDIARIRRGTRDWPVSGVSLPQMSTLRAVGFRWSDDSKKLYGHFGQSATSVMILRERGRIESWSATPYGASDDPRSPHFSDQAEKLFAKGELKPTWHRFEDLQDHIESNTVLTYHRSPADE